MKNNNRQKAFTLVEMLVSIAIFSFVMVATTSVLLSVVDANHKAQGLKTAIDDLSLALESMTRNLRTGSQYVDVIGPFSSGNCQSPGQTGIMFVGHDGVSTQYYLQGNAIEISKQNQVTGNYSPSDMTAPEIKIDRLCFYISGADPNDKVQPRILITLGGVVSPTTVAGAQLKTTSRFDIQAFVSQRLPDVPTN